MVTLKNQSELDRMREAGRVVARTLRRVADAVEPGVSLAELDAIAAACIREHGARSSFLGYHPHFTPTPYPAVLCLSVNDVIVHGIPGERRLETGDILSIDCGAEVGGYHGDAAVTVPVGPVDEAAERLMKATSEALAAGIAAAVPGGRLGDIGYAIERVARPYGLLDGYGGHGIGTEMHQDPHVLNHGKPGKGPRLVAGMALAIEPMITAGDPETVELEDGWTVITADGARAVHWEHSVAITEDGPRVLTLP
jgi:methionyl aminopeptidase